MSPISARLCLEGWDPEPSSSLHIYSEEAKTQEVILNIGFISLHLTLGKLFNFPEAEFLPLGKKKKGVGRPLPSEFIELH